MEYLARGATNGIPTAATYMGLALLNTNLGPADAEQAWAWIDYALQQDDMLAEVVMARRYLSAPMTPGNVTSGTNLLWRGVQKGHANCMYLLAQLLVEGTITPKDTTAGWSLMKRAAALGHAPAQTTVAGQAFASPPTESVETALRYYALAADQNWPPALATLGYHYCLGKHVERDELRGWSLLRRAALMDEPRAAYSYGVSVLKGERAITNEAAGIAFLRSSAEQGYPAAQNFYGLMLSAGDERDIVAAWKWYELAAAAKDSNAIVNMQKLRDEITPAQMEQARREAALFLPAIKGLAGQMVLQGRPVSP